MFHCVSHVNDKIDELVVVLKLLSCTALPCAKFIFLSMQMQSYDEII